MATPKTPKRKPGRPPRADRAEIETKVLAAIRVGLTLAGGWVRGSTPTYGGQARRPALDRRRVAGLDGRQ